MQQGSFSTSHIVRQPQQAALAGDKLDPVAVPPTAHAFADIMWASRLPEVAPSASQHVTGLRDQQPHYHVLEPIITDHLLLDLPKTGRTQTFRCLRSMPFPAKKSSLSSQCFVSRCTN